MESTTSIWPEEEVHLGLQETDEWRWTAGDARPTAGIASPTTWHTHRDTDNKATCWQLHTDTPTPGADEAVRLFCWHVDGYVRKQNRKTTLQSLVQQSNLHPSKHFSLSRCFQITASKRADKHRRPKMPHTLKPAQSAQFPDERGPNANKWMMTKGDWLNVAGRWFQMGWVFQKLLIYWDFLSPTSPEFSEEKVQESTERQVWTSLWM